MERRKLTREDIDKVRDIEGFPVGTDEDIIALSDAPFYTACPNPFIEEFIREHGTPYDEATDDYHREPFAADVSEGKYDPIYKLHTYHTKVPHLAIMRYIMNYTNPGDIILDGFCGTGMTGVATNLCENPPFEVKNKIEHDVPHSKWGKRYAIINDLSTAATFFSANYNSAVSPEFSSLSKDIITKLRAECGWMYRTKHAEESPSLFSSDAYGEINYTVWSDVFICPNCGNEMVFWDVAVDYERGKVNDKFNCPKCRGQLKKNNCQHAKTILFDKALGKTVELSKQVPVMINYSYLGKRYEKKPDAEDLEVVSKIEDMEIPYWYPTDTLEDGDKTSDATKLGITNAHLFYTRRTLYVLSCYYALSNKDLSCLFAFTKVANQMTKQYRLTYMNGCWGAGGGPMSGTLYIPSLLKELNVLTFLEKALEIQQVRNYAKQGNVLVSSQSTTDYRQIPPNSIDYIFTDPPFGDNLMYSELNFLWESWLKVKTQNRCEAIVNNSQNKAVPDYMRLMERCFAEYFRILKPGRWITVEFHNSKNSVWNAIQSALSMAGFIVADVRTLDKQHSSYNQVNASSQAIKQDLVISAYKPKESFLHSFISSAGNAETAWSFVSQHLSNLPVVVIKADKIEIVAERQAFLLFDRMVAYHIMQGIPVPMDATDFYKGLDERYLKRDEMYFLPDQVNEYDTARIKTDVEPIQFSLFVTNEKTAISWLYQQLSDPQTYSEIQPKFMQEVKSVDRYEDMPELAVLLEENFLQDEKGRWYIPDVTKEGDVAKLREKKLWKEFEGYMNSKGKLKLFRSEAIRVGFSRLWKDKSYQAIVDIANRLPEQTIQEDPNLLMYYDISLSRV
jgi:DNA modification methylase/predicted RNA-binding Zn-ribbon protein involved in translation (DUF1610 family)